MKNKKKIPVGVDGFEKVITNDFYFIDKTELIRDLLHNWGEVNLFTRPRRFGKSLNMSMLQCFFEIGRDESLFDGLRISKEKELCEAYMGKFPVIFLTLKSVDGRNYEMASAALRNLVGNEALRFDFLLKSDRLSEKEKDMYVQLTKIDFEHHAVFSMSDAVVMESLKTLSMLLYKHYNQKVIILIDEYDVPLDKAFQNDYYDEMVALMRSFLGNALKTNKYLQFAVLTGCLRISKESIFTGLNNLKVNTITDNRYDAYFGFTSEEVKELLDYYELSDRFDTVKEWYDGYWFGNEEVYCPWDVINYCSDALPGEETEPENYWANTSGNGMVRRFIDKANQQTRNEIESLITGEAITKVVNMELTYNELDTTIENLWSVLFTTGYLTLRGREEGRRYKLAIPNKEIRELFITQIREWFRETTRKDAPKLERFCKAFPAGDVVQLEEMLGDYLWSAISIRDTAVRNEQKENFYHGMLLGLLQYEDEWLIKSNAESGEGYSDILIETRERVGVVIEVKYAQDGNLEKGCRKALAQIETKGYTARLEEDGMKKIIRYGIAFYKKLCKVAIEEG